MKIAIFTPYNIFQHGGVQEHVYYQSTYLRQRGHNVTVLTPRPRLAKKTPIPEGVVFLGGSTRIKTPSATSADVSISIDPVALDAELAKGYDIIHVHEPLVPIAARQILAKAAGKSLRIGTFHAALPGNILGKSLVATYKTYARSVLPHIDVITAVSPAAVGYVGEYTDLSIQYIPNGFHAISYRPKKLIRDENMILFIGRLEKRKGARQAIKAFAELKQRKPRAKLVIAGDGPLRRSLENFVQLRDISDVTFLGYIDNATKLHLLNTCGVFTSPALYGESFGIVLLEAMAMGAPIVCHQNDGYTWVMKDTGRLSLVDCTDPTAYAQRLQLMMEDARLRSVWQEWANSYVTQFDYEKIVDAYEGLYQKILKK